MTTLATQAHLAETFTLRPATLDDLPEAARADVRGLIGWTVARDEVLAGERTRDRWAVLGRVVEPDERLLVQRTWLYGLQTRRHALVLAFAAAGQSLDPGGLLAGTVIDASLAFYPSAAPLRALVAERHAAPEPLRAPPGELSDGFHLLRLPQSFLATTALGDIDCFRDGADHIAVVVA